MQHLLHIALSNAVLAIIPATAAVLAARYRCRPVLVHAFWLLALAKLLTPPLVEIPVPMALAGANNTTGQTVRESEMLVGGPDLRGDSPVEPRPSNAAGSPVTRVVRFQATPLLLAIVWIAGSVAVLIVAVGRAWSFGRILRYAEPASRVMRAQAEQVAACLGLRCSPPILLVPGNVPPMLWAFGSRARLLIPGELWARLTARQQQSLLAHELAHWQRCDHYVRYIELAATALYWWHPLVWWARRGLREAEEQCCDARVVRAWPDAARDYATALVEAVDFVSETPVPALGSGMASAQDLMRRVTMIMQDRRPRGLSAGGWLAVLAVSAVLPLLPRAVNAEDREKDAPRQKAENAPRDGEKREGEVWRDGARREGEVRREGERREGEIRRDGETRREGREGDDRPRQRPINGRLIRIEGRSLFIAVGDAQREMVIPLEDDTRYWLGREDVTLQDLKPGMQVSITQDDGLTRHVRANPPRGEGRRDGEGRQEGPRDGERPRGEERAREGDRAERQDAPPGVRPVNAEIVEIKDGNLIVHVGENRRELTVPVQPETQVLLNGQPAKVEDLQRGTRVAIIQVEGLTSAIHARSRQGQFARPTVPGQVVKVDGDVATIRYFVDGEDVTVKTDGKSDCLIGGRVRSASELKAGQKVNVMVREHRAAFVEVVEQRE